jgi:hypothetical protein
MGIQDPKKRLGFMWRAFREQLLPRVGIVAATSTGMAGKSSGQIQLDTLRSETHTFHEVEPLITKENRDER